MQPGCEPLYSAAQVRELDRLAIEQRGVPGYELMTRAGAAAFAALRRHWPEARRVHVLCGAGNNAGDGYVLARLARAEGWYASVGWLADPGRLQGAARTAWEDAVEAGVTVAPFDAGRLTACEVIVDGLLGTGLQRGVEGDWAAAIAAVNASGVPVLALDIPSGLAADTGRVPGTAIRAALTVTFIGRKLGLYTGQAADYVGELVFAGLELPADLAADMPPRAWLAGYDCAAARLAPRSRTAHKGAFGHVLIVGGRPGMGGAARLAGEAAARVGAGLVSVATDPGHVAAVLAARPELMAAGVDGAPDLEPLLERASVIGLGPGLGQGRWSRALFERLLRAEQPLVLDADALNLLAAAPLRRDDWVLTPHPGEAARLLGTDTAAVEADRVAAVQQLQQRYGGVVLLKGAGSLVCDGAVVWIAAGGNPGMASGGMGDVLTGVIAGLRAQGLTPAEATVAGAVLHAAAADRAARDGERGLLAGDLLTPLRALVNPGQDHHAAHD
ncbi:carbohydrate kinase [Thiohalobacter thiocyanaticus]|uniref:Bifunctional NAD(P)H-hydrate repair enzyme n=1 Tax=Thiohalobacter thiocyanaticus TaxID=585455 RepID=A0A1Z4VUK6_9GAMM|nr:NAD(P)H-hydrate dehydratase [Thiohalobacter thiocyanaticus]BAZ94874.1 carbohydrate kinase [Thiohalobacter thiocyanaticus]